MACHPAELDRVQKTQVVRALDVVLVGPLMILGGFDLQQRRPILGQLLSFIGVSTMVYNAKNLYTIDRASGNRLGSVYMPGTGWIYRDDDRRATDTKTKCKRFRFPKQDCRYEVISGTRRVVCRRQRM